MLVPTTRCSGLERGTTIQTFLPYANPAKSAEALDYRRLGKQRVETYQILNSLIGASNGWLNHPAVKMWAGYEIALADYGLAMCDEWIARGYKDTTRDKILEIKRGLVAGGESGETPRWLGEENLHLSHQSNLLRKDPIYYGQLFIGIPDDMPYVWPV